MQYTYDVIKGKKRIHTTTDWTDALNEYNNIEGSKSILVTYPKGDTFLIKNEEDIEGFEESLVRRIWLLRSESKSNSFDSKSSETNEFKKVKENVDPPHYQAYFGGNGVEELQWLEAKQYQNHWQNPEIFIPAVILQADKYLSRLGKKDASVQEIMKAIWYLKFVAAYIANNNKPIRIKDIDNILSKY
jgi:hypothetical protein